MSENLDFSKNFAYKLSKANILVRLNIVSTHFEIEFLTNIVNKILNTIPIEIKEASSIEVFKNNIRKLKTEKNVFLKPKLLRQSAERCQHHQKGQNSSLSFNDPVCHGTQESTRSSSNVYKAKNDSK